MDGLQKSILLWRDWRCMGGREKNIMTVQFNITETPGYGTYLDDATDMPYGKDPDAVSQWQEFFGYKPCLFKNGQVVGYLNPNDYTKFENGTSADITSGNAGDVMVEFPRRGIKISKSGSTVTVSMTKDPDNPDFTYYAHTRGSTRKDKFYVGAYLGWRNSDNGTLRSLSGKSPTTYYSLSSFRSFANNLGSGYMEVGFYQFLFIQCMYLLQYKGHLNSQEVHGYGYVNNDSYSNSVLTGSTNTSGMMYGNQSSSTDHIKLFGIEDFWGYFYWYIDGYYIDSNYHSLTATDGFNNTGSGYTDHGMVVSIKGFSGAITDAICTSELGFTPIKYKSHSSFTNTYFCDECAFFKEDIIYVGGCMNSSSDGIFRFEGRNKPYQSYEMNGGRLAYL